MIGWIKVHRKLMDKSFYSKDSEKVHLWIHILMKANHSGKEESLGGKPFKCEPGQFTTGRKQLSIETGIGESKIERMLTYFEKIEQQIEQQKTSVNRLISVCNWSTYQNSEQPIEQESNNDRTTSEQRVDTLKEIKNNNNEKNDKNETVIENWRLDYDIYCKYIDIEFEKIKKDTKWIKEQEKVFPKLDILKSIEKAIVVYWKTDTAWTKRKKGKSKTLDWKKTFSNTMEINRVEKYIQRLAI